MHNAQPSSYSARTRTVSPTLMASSSGRLTMKVQTTVAEEGDRAAEVGE